MLFNCLSPKTNGSSESLSRNVSACWLQTGNMEIIKVNPLEGSLCPHTTQTHLSCGSFGIFYAASKLSEACNHVHLSPQTGKYSLSQPHTLFPLHRHHSGVPLPHSSIPTFSKRLPRGNLIDVDVDLSILSGLSLRCP